MREQQKELPRIWVGNLPSTVELHCIHGRKSKAQVTQESKCPGSQR